MLCLFLVGSRSLRRHLFALARASASLVLKITAFSAGFRNFIRLLFTLCCVVFRESLEGSCNRTGEGKLRPKPVDSFEIFLRPEAENVLPSLAVAFYFGRAFNLGCYGT